VVASTSRPADRHGARRFTGLRYIVGHGPNELFQLQMTVPLGFPKGPNVHFLFGADQVGRDVFVRSLYGPRTPLLIAVVAADAAIALGTAFGILAGYLAAIGWFSRSTEDSGSVPFDHQNRAFVQVLSGGVTQQPRRPSLRDIFSPGACPPRLPKNRRLTVGISRLCSAERGSGPLTYLVSLGPTRTPTKESRGARLNKRFVARR
jgi:hypothetical protein